MPFAHRLAALLQAVVLCFVANFAGSLSIASAGPLDAPLVRFADDSFPETALAIEEIARSGAPGAVDILEALADRRLLLDPATKAVLIKEKSGEVRDVASGKVLASLPANATLVRINNRLRGAIDAGLGSLVLVSADPAKRLAAADSLFKSRQPGDLAALDTALASETDRGVRSAFERARAAILLTRPGAVVAEQLDAITLLANKTDGETLGLLRQVEATTASPQIKDRIQSAIASFEQRRIVTAGVQNVVYGLSLGSVLLLAAIGLAITFGVMGVINMAHGEMVMIGAYTTFVVQEAFRAWAPGAFDLSLPVAIPLAFLVTGLIGVAIERGIIRFLYGRPLETLLATWGVSLFLQQVVRSAFGPTNREVGNPSYMSGGFDILGVSITWGRLWIIVFTLAVFFALQLVLKRTRLGLEMRAVTQNRRMAASMGIRSARVDALTFGLGSGIAGIAGVALSQIDNVSPNLGQSYIVDSFMVVVFGGVGNLWGTLVSAFFLGIANKLLEPLAGAVLAKILILVLLILFIQKRPRGLFALKGRAVEA